MRKVVAVLFAMAVFAVPGVASAGGQVFSTELLGANEVPGPGDPDGSGTAVLTINRGIGEICWTIEVEGIDPIFAAHIHPGAAGVAGGVLVPLMPNDVFAPTGCVAVDRELAKTIAKNPSDYYVNVHTEPFPAGALRGQLG
jgi:CHRD domain